MKYVKHNFISHLKWPFAGTIPRLIGKTSLLNPYAVQGHESRHYTGLRKLLFLYHLFFPLAEHLIGSVWVSPILIFKIINFFLLKLKAPSNSCPRSPQLF